MLRIGMLTPSSNTVLEPVTYAMLADAPGVSAHFARFTVTAIGLDAQALGQFDDSNILAAAEMLAHAKVDVIAWNGTSASWLGLDRDRQLVSRIEAATGIPAATCVLGYFDLFARLGVKRLGLVTPYTEDVQKRIAETYAGEGVTVTSERHLGIRDNFTFGTVAPATIGAMIGEVAADAPDAIAILCTNMNGAAESARLEAEIGIPVLDFVAVTLWACLDRIGADTAPLARWGRLFAPR